MIFKFSSFWKKKKSFLQVLFSIKPHFTSFKIWNFSFSNFCKTKATDLMSSAAIEARITEQWSGSIKFRILSTKKSRNWIKIHITWSSCTYTNQKTSCNSPLCSLRKSSNSRRISGMFVSDSLKLSFFYFLEGAKMKILNPNSLALSLSSCPNSIFSSFLWNLLRFRLLSVLELLRDSFFQAKKLNQETNFFLIQ